MRKLNQSGFGAFEILLLVVLVLIVSGAGFFAWNNSKNSDSANSASASSWTTVKSTRGSWTVTSSYKSFSTISFVPASGKPYRICFKGRSTGEKTTINIQPQAYGSVRNVLRSTSQQCSRSWTAPSGYMSTMIPTLNKIGGPNAVVTEVTVQKLQ